MTLANKVQQFSDDADKLHSIVHGPASGAGSTVDTEGGTRRTFAKIDADLEGQGYVGTVLQAKDDVLDAKAQTEAARDMAQFYAGIKGSTAEGLAGTSSGQYFSVPSATDSESLILYKNNAGAAQEVKRTASARAAEARIGLSGVAFGNPDTGEAFLFVTPDKIEHPQVTQLAADVAAASGGSNITTRIGPVGLALGDSATGAVFAFVTPDKIEHPQVTQLAADVLAAGGGANVSSRIGPPGVAFGDPITGDVMLFVTESTLTHATLALDKQVLDRTNPALLTAAKMTAGSLVCAGRWGQSGAIGTLGTPPLSTAALAYASSFTGGARPFDGGADNAANRASLVALKEQTSGTLGETGMTSAWAMFDQLLQSENGITLAGGYGAQGLAYVEGIGGQPISVIGPGTATFTRLGDDIAAARTLGAAAGRPVCPGGISADHGESQITDSQDAYYAALKSVHDGYNALWSAALGRSVTVPFLIRQKACHTNYGASTPSVAMAQLKYANDDVMAAIICPQYMLKFADDVHPDASGQRLMGAYEGIALKRYLIDGVKPTCLQPASVARDGAFLTVGFSGRVGALVLDTVTMTNPGDYGIDIVSPTGVAQVISSVSVVGGRELLIRCAANVPAGSVVRFGWKTPSDWNGATSFGTGYKNSLAKWVGPRINIRDSQGDTVKYDPTGLNLPLHNWCVISSITAA